ncbi:MAG: FecR family protein [Sphingobacteriaceae bacterium]
MEKKKFLSLIDKYLNGTATAAEQQLIEEYYKRLDVKGKTLLNPDQENALKQLMLHNILMQTQNETAVVSLNNRTSKRRFWLQSAAASLILLLSAGLYFYKKTEPVTIASVKKEIPVDIPAGGNAATLTLADGTRILLDDAQNGVLASEGNTSVKKTKDGQLVYDLSNLNALTNSKLTYNTISTPNGGQYQVILPDGTKVWLNAGSSLTFPTAFKGNERKVTMEGEAYFEVAKNKLAPFRVEAMGQTVEVLGTHFNVMAYNDESSVQTTLLEGSVRVIKNKNSQVIVPGEQAKVKGDYISVTTEDTKAITAWKDGFFVFKSENIQSIMRKISRWYNVKINYEGNVSNKSFGGKISRNRNISEVLEMLELTGSVHFKIASGNERRITVMP